jgi:hypothetical protein
LRPQPPSGTANFFTISDNMVVFVHFIIYIAIIPAAHYPMKKKNRLKKLFSACSLLNFCLPELHME